MDMITVEKRDFAVKAKKLRRLGLVPGSVFGGPLREALALQLEEADARRLVEQKREGSKLKIVLDGEADTGADQGKGGKSAEQDILQSQFSSSAGGSKSEQRHPYFFGQIQEKVTDALERMLEWRSHMRPIAGRYD